MWEGLFFKYTSAVLGLLGSVIGIVLYFIHDSLLPDDPELAQIVLWFYFSVILALGGFSCGKLIHKLHYWAYRDQLTNLWNSRYFYSQLTKEIKRMERIQSSLCVALIDLDDFKVINDTYGHVAGDQVLKAVATILGRNTRVNDIVIRWGGDEFAIIFPDTNLENTSLLVERLRGMIERSSDCRQVTISVGVLLVQAEVEVTQLLNMVDETLYKAKKTKNLVVATTYS